YAFNYPNNAAIVGEPQLTLSYLGPTSSSGHGDLPGGGDFAVTFGLWGSDDVPGSSGLACQPNPAAGPLPTGQFYCANLVGTALQQAGTLMHELGHTLTLTHGGTYYTNPAPNQNAPVYDINCKPNYLSSMNYLFQVRGFPGADQNAIVGAN